jgi:REP element-mobilizing transposase RayT
MPPRPPIDPTGIYHVCARGTYGRPLFRTAEEHELFLAMYERIARKNGWYTLAWALMKNHHHFVVELTKGGLSAGLRELHSGYSRRIHATYGQTRKGHLFRHAFFARQLLDERGVVHACAYVDLNPTANRLTARPRRTDWCGCGATLGLVTPRRFHSPERLLRRIGVSVAQGRVEYRRLLEELHSFRQLDQSPNHGVGTATRL